jgi:DNA-binding transcriptional regulator YdaS (Cro superfamily)
MDLNSYLRSGGDSVNATRLRDTARKAGTSTKYLYLIALGHKRPGPKIAMAIEKATKGEVTLFDLRSDLWSKAA